jgi:hypothetical protein
MQVTDNGKEPNEWPVVHFANVGTSEEFVEVFSEELLEPVDASHILGAERDAVKAAIMTVLVEGLMPAFEHQRKIRLSVSNSIPELNRRQLYEESQGHQIQKGTPTDARPGRSWPAPFQHLYRLQILS